MFANLYLKTSSLFGRLHREQDAQDAFEYMLVIGGVSVAIVLAMAAVPGLTGAIVTGVCNAIDTVPNMTMAC